MRRTRTGDTYCAHHGVNRGHITAECIVISREFYQYHDLFQEFLQTRGLGPYTTEPGGRHHRRNRHHPSGGCGRGRGGGFRQLQPPNSPHNLPPDLPPDLPRGQFHNGPRHYFSASYPYGNINRGYSRWEAAARHWSPPRAITPAVYSSRLSHQSYHAPPYLVHWVITPAIVVRIL